MIDADERREIYLKGSRVCGTAKSAIAYLYYIYKGCVGWLEVIFCFFHQCWRFPSLSLLVSSSTCEMMCFFVTFSCRRDWCLVNWTVVRRCSCIVRLMKAYFVWFFMFYFSAVKRSVTIEFWSQSVRVCWFYPHLITPRWGCCEFIDRWHWGVFQIIN